jgi:transcriptional regulator with XRE-family HTH domain
MDNKSIAGRIRRIREDENLSMKDLSHKIGIPKRTIDNYERGINPPSTKYINLLSTIFGVDSNWILTGEGNMRPDEQGVLHFGIVNQPPILNTREAAKKVSDAITMTLRVLSSETSYADALYLNIVHFDRAIQAERQQKLDATRLSILEKQVAELTQQIKGLQEGKTGPSPLGSSGDPDNTDAGLTIHETQAPFRKTT